MKSLLPLTLCALLLLGCGTVSTLPSQPSTHLSVESIDAAVRARRAGAEVARRTEGWERIDIREITPPAFPYQVFVVRLDSATHYTLLVESEDSVVTLCGGFGGGWAYDLAVKRRGHEVIIRYNVSLGSGMQLGGLCDYVVGSGGLDARQARADRREEERKARQNKPLQGTEGKRPSSSTQLGALRP